MEDFSEIDKIFWNDQIIIKIIFTSARTIRYILLSKNIETKIEIFF